MNSIIISGFYYPLTPGLPSRIISELASFDKIIYLATKQELCLNSSRVKVYDVGDLNFLKYPDYIDSHEIQPLDESVIKEYSECEQTCLKMFDRLEFWVDFPYEKRKKFYLYHLKYWHYMINRYNINFMIASNTPHEIYDWIIYCILKRKGAKMFFGHVNGVFYDRYIIDSDFYKFPLFEKKYEAFLNNGDCRISKEVLSYYEEKNKKPEDTHAPFYTQKQFREKRGRYLLSNKSWYIKRYNKQASYPMDGEKFVYLALHYQPECTTFPHAGSYVDQLLIVDLLSNYLPPDIMLYVKEHSYQNSVGRTSDYYRQIKSYKNVRLIRSDVNTYYLIDKAICTCTCTGTICIESIIRNKPSILFGNEIYQFAPGVFSVKTNDDLRFVMDKILNNEYKIDAAEVKKFLQFLYQESIESVIDSTFKNFLKISLEQNSDNLLQAIKGILA